MSKDLRTPDHRRRWPGLISLASVLLLSTVIGVIVSAHTQGKDQAKLASTSTGSSCQATDEIFLGVRGSGETADQANGLGYTVGAVYAHLKTDLAPRQVLSDAVDYQAESVPLAAELHNYSSSVSGGLSSLINDLYQWTHRCPSNHLVLVGYSQGADVVGEAIAELRPSDPVESSIISRIDGIILLGDPHYLPNSAYDINAAAIHGGILQYPLPSRSEPSYRQLPSWAVGETRSYCMTGDAVCDFTPSHFASCALVFALADLGAELVTALGRSCLDAVAADVDTHTSYFDMPQPNYPEDAATWLTSLATAGTSNAPAPAAVAPCERLAADVTMPDGIIVQPGQRETKTWRLVNCGASWTGTTAVLMSGVGAPATFAVPPVAAEATAEISVSFSAPGTAGHYRWVYQLRNGHGNAAGSFWLDFTVAAPSRTCSAFVADDTLPDGTSLAPGTGATKIWILRNCGNVSWSGLHAQRVAGDFGPAQFAVPALAPGQSAQVSTPITAPPDAGPHRATYRLQDGAGTYAVNGFWIDITVSTAPIAPTPPTPAAPSPTQPLPAPSPGPPPPIGGDVPPTSDPGQPLPGGAVVLGPIDLNRYCQHGWGLYAQDRFPNAWGWRCSTSPLPATGERLGDQDIDTVDACRLEYGPDAGSRYRVYTDPNSWYCYRT